MKIDKKEIIYLIIITVLAISIFFLISTYNTKTVLANKGVENKEGKDATNKELETCTDEDCYAKGLGCGNGICEEGEEMIICPDVMCPEGEECNIEDLCEPKCPQDCNW